MPQVKVVPQSGVGPVELAVGDRDQQHRQERQQEHGRRAIADGQHHVPERRGQAVRRGSRSEPDGDVAPQAEGAGLKSLACGRFLLDDFGHCPPRFPDRRRRGGTNGLTVAVLHAKAW